jgi:putative heme-binding domain-containing protein
MSLSRPSLLAGIAMSIGLGILHVTAESDPFAENIRTTDPLPPAEERTHFRLPAGFEVQLVASEPDINKPMNMAFDGDGRLWITTSIEYPFPAPASRPARDRLMIFSDFGPDGKARKVTEFANGLNLPIGVSPFRSRNAAGIETWRAIVWSIPNIWLLEDTDGDGKADKKELLYGPFDTTRDTHGMLASFRRGWDGWLYGTHGFNNDSHVHGRDGHMVNMNSGNTWRAMLDGSRIEHHTHGQVNPFGLAWDPRGNLYSSDCHSAPIYQLLDGGYYPSFGKPNDGLGFAPVMMEHAHGSTAIDGALYYADDLWPAEFTDNFFLGNVMTSRLNRDQLVFHGSSPTAIEKPDFLTTDDPWFRPVDNQLGPDGAIYVADFYNRIIGHYEVPLTHPGRDHERGRIWRIVYHGQNGQAALRPPALKKGLDGLIEELASPNLTRRMLAMNELTDRFGADEKAVKAVEMAFETPVGSVQKTHAMWILWRLNHFNAAQLEQAARHFDAIVRTHAMRVLAATVPTLKTPAELGWASGLALAGLKDSDALTRRCAAEALAARPQFENVHPLLQAIAGVDKADSHLIYVLRKALRDQLADHEVAVKIIAETWNETEARALAGVAIAVPSSDAAALLLRQLQKLGDQLPAGLSAGDILKHAARYAPESELGNLADFAQRHFANDPGAQLDLFKAVDQGLQQRGVAVPAQLNNWGRRLAAGVLLSKGNGTWKNVPFETEPTRDPWDFQERTLADGTKAHLLSSLPHGEKLTGRLVGTFVLPAQLSFWYCGHDGYPNKPPQGNNIVRLRGADGKTLFEAKPPRNDVAQKVTWDLGSHAGEKGTFEAIDGDTGDAYAWIAVGGFQGAAAFSDASPAVFTERAAAACDLIARIGWADPGAEPPPGALASLRDDALQGGDAELRTAAVRAAVATAPANSKTQWLEPLISDGHEPVAVREVAGSLVGQYNPGALASALKSAPTQLQLKWAAILAANVAGANALIDAVATGLAPARILQDRSVRDKFAALHQPSIDAKIGDLTRNLPPPDQGKDKLIAERRKSYNAALALPAEGEKVFQQNCAICHQLNGKGGLVGPQLTGIGNRGLDRLCEDILDPNRNVDRAFRQSVLTLKDGETISGLFRREEGELLVLANAAGQEFTVKKADVTERRESELSLMPDNFADAIPKQNFDHLLAYLLRETGR